MTQSGSRAERKRHTRALLVEAARSTVAASGFSALALREVARAAGIVPTAFYRHFESLDALVEELSSEAAARFREVVAELSDLADAPPWEAWPPRLETAAGQVPESWAVFVRALVDGASPAHRPADDALRDARRRLGISLSRNQALADRSAAQVDTIGDLLSVEIVRSLAAGAVPGSVSGWTRVECEDRIRLICGA